MVDDRVKGAVGLLRGAKTTDAQKALALETVGKRHRQMRFSDASLAGQKDDLTFAFFCLRPAAAQQFVFLFAADERRHSAWVQGFKAARRGTWPKNRPDLDRRRNSLQVLCSEVFEL